MRLILDANVVLRNILGKRRTITRALNHGIALMVPEAQVIEAAKVLVRKQHISERTSYQLVVDATVSVDVLEMAGLQGAEAAARERLGQRGQPDWPVLAAAMLLDADIWSDDRDFFGVGVPVWCRTTIDIAIAQVAAA